MGDGRVVDPAEIREVGEQICPDIANWLDDAGSAISSAADSRGSSFGSHAVVDTWNEFYGLFYECVYETAQNTRAIGMALVEIAETTTDLEADLASTFESIEGEIEQQPAAPSSSANYETPPESAPAPEEDNPFHDALSDDPKPA